MSSKAGMAAPTWSLKSAEIMSVAERRDSTTSPAVCNLRVRTVRTFEYGPDDIGSSEDFLDVTLVATEDEWVATEASEADVADTTTD